MNNAEINETMLALSQKSWALELMYNENGGEVTPETEALEADIQDLTERLLNEGVDSLGRWLKGKQDEIATYKAEKAAAEAKIRAAQKTEEFIKTKIYYLLEATGQDKVKGSFYGFARSESRKSSIRDERLNERWLDDVQKAARAFAGLPECIDVYLKTTTTRLTEAGLDEYVEVATAPAVKFSKPRAGKE